MRYGSSHHLYENGRWTFLPSLSTWTGLGEGDERWMISGGEIFRWSHKTNDWENIPGPRDDAAVTIDAQNPCRIIMTTESHKIYIWKNNNWVQLPGNATRATITENHYYIINSNEEIFVMTSAENYCHC